MHPLKIHGFNTNLKSKAIGPQLQTAWICIVPSKVLHEVFQGKLFLFKAMKPSISLLNSS